MVAEWAAATGVPLEPWLATVLFVGIATDCGWFRFANTDARTLRVAAELLAAGAAADRIHAAIYQQDRPERLKLVGRLLQSLELHADGQLAVMYLRPADFAAAGADRDCTENLINEAGRLGCTEATILFTEETGCIRVNFRSKLRLDVSALASRFGGGGHTRAAGAAGWRLGHSRAGGHRYGGRGAADMNAAVAQSADLKGRTPCQAHYLHTRSHRRFAWS